MDKLGDYLARKESFFNAIMGKVPRLPGDEQLHVVADGLARAGFYRLSESGSWAKCVG